MDQLPDDLIQKIFCCVWSGTQDSDPATFRWFRHSIPQVCARWRRLLDCPSPIWEAVAVDIHAESVPKPRTAAPSSSPPRCPPNVVPAEQVLSWLRRKGPSVRRLTLDLSASHHTFQPRHFHQLCLIAKRTLASLSITTPAALCSRDTWDALSNLKALATLSLSNCPIEFLEVGLPALAFLPHLHSLTLDLSRDDPREVRALRFPPHLTSLSVSHLHSKTPTRAPSITHLPRLIHLTLASCFLPAHDIFTTLANPSILQHLAVGNTVHLPQHQLPPLPALRTLAYTSSPLPRVPSFSTPPQHLASIDFSLNPPDRLPPSLSHLPALTHLCLSRCSLSTLPPLLLTVPYLKSLDLSNNSLVALPKSPPTFAPTLQTLDISCNRLQTLAPWVWACTSLTALTASSTAAAGTADFDRTVLQLPLLARLQLVGPSYDVGLVNAILRLTKQLAADSCERPLELLVT